MSSLENSVSPGSKIFLYGFKHGFIYGFNASNIKEEMDEISEEVKQEEVEPRYYDVDSTYWVDEPIDYIRELMNFLEEKILKIDGVESVFVKPLNKNNIDVWTIIKEKNDRLLDTIYQAEIDIMNNYKEILFDFSVIFQGNHKIEEIVPTGAIQL